jgi:hypothetical protein
MIEFSRVLQPKLVGFGRGRKAVLRKASRNSPPAGQVRTESRRKSLLPPSPSIRVLGTPRLWCSNSRIHSTVLTAVAAFDDTVLKLRNEDLGDELYLLTHVQCQNVHSTSLIAPAERCPDRWVGNSRASRESLDRHFVTPYSWLALSG